MKNERRSYKQKYWVRLQNNWWCYKCRKFVNYEDCKNHKLYYSKTVRNKRQLHKIINRLLLRKEGKITITRFSKWSPSKGHHTQDFVYEW